MVDVGQGEIRDHHGIEWPNVPDNANEVIIAEGHQNIGCIGTHSIGSEDEYDGG